MMIEIDRDALRRLIADTGKTQHELSVEMGSSPTYISGIINVGRINNYKLALLCNILGCEASDITGEKPDEKPERQVRTVDYTDALNHLARAAGDLDAMIAGFEKKIENIEKVVLFNRWALKQVCPLMGVRIDDRR